MFKLILIPLLASFAVQAIKLATDKIRGNFTWKNFFKDYGGMPSGHSAYVASLATMIAIEAGINSVAFAISVALAIIVIRDAVGFRRAIGKNAIFTNMIAKTIYKTKNKKFTDKIDYLTESMGHSWPEVLVGSAIGIALALILNWLTFII